MQLAGYGYDPDAPNANYTLSLDLVDDKSASPSTAGKFTADTGEVYGFIGAETDKDWIATDLAEGSTYLFQVLGKSSENGTLLDPARKSITRMI